MENKVTIKEIPFDQRPRERILAGGVSFLSDSELLCVLLGSGGKNSDIKTISERILSLEGGIRELADYEPEEFLSIDGIGPAKACTLVAALELGRRVNSSRNLSKIKIENPVDCARIFMEDLRYLKTECFMAALLNGKNELIMKHQISAGGINYSYASARDVFSYAIKKGAGAIILSHNHPSGDPSPSAPDIEITKKMAEAGDLLGIKLLDHIIIGDGIYFSLREANYL